MEIELTSPTNAFAVTTRALAVHDGKLLVCHQSHDDSFFALPGGKLQVGETIAAGLTRELLEETGIRAQVGELLIINEWVGASNHRLEFFCWIRNAADFAAADLATASHGHEISDLMFADPTTPQVNLLPTFLADRFASLLKLGEKFPLEHIRSL
jgi:ADP-ribose pyrophosphatase YjhB (NUDIX family)